MKKYCIQKITTILIYVLLIASLSALIFSSWIVFQMRKTGDQPAIGGYHIMVIATGSMAPKINPGDVVLVKKVSTQDLKVGDIITYYSIDSNIFGKVISHRISDIAKSEEGYYFTTKGDANQIKDNYPALEANILGRVDKVIPKLGYALMFIKSKQGLLVLGFTPSLIILILEIRNLILLIGQYRKEKREYLKNRV